ncbi:MAG: phosphatase PAP2 family protein [Alphaproteobacteria bacterium]|nr:phosphatase PAP2 family protein [Alphaproteobacteria bacterium]
MKVVRLFVRFPELAVLVAMLVVTFAAALWLGTSLVLPDGRMSFYLGFRYAVPLGLAALWLAVPLATDRLLRRGQPPRVQARDLAWNGVYLVVFSLVMWLHFHLKMWIPLLNPRRYDAFYQAIDVALAPLLTATIAVRQAVAVLLPSVDWWYMWAFIVLFFVSFSYHTASDTSRFRPVFLATLINQSLGAVAYCLAPAVGPFLYDRGLNAMADAQQQNMWAAYQQLTATGPAWLESYGQAYFVAGLAAMPSLHVGASWIFVWYVFRARSHLRLPYVLLFAWIVIEAMASKWHYLIDLPAGIVLAAVAIWIANRLCTISIRTA